ncbi:MAG: hypothetical protein U1A27_05770 [Phycisphaerae bacterium]
MSDPAPRANDSTVATASRRSWRDWLGLNASTLALLGAIFLVTASTELWSPLVPQYLKALRERALAGDVGLVWLIGLYGFYRDALEALNYYVGGAVAGRINTRRALLIFNLLPLAGLAVLMRWQSPGAVFVAVPFLFVWDSVAGPAVVSVVGDALPADRRTMAFSLQAILRRLSRMAAYLVSGLMVWRFGRVQGVRGDALIACGLVLFAWGVQFRLMRTGSRDAVRAWHRPRALWRRFPADLRVLLAADVLARWAEGIAKPFLILYCVPLLSAALDRGTAAYQSVLLNIEAATNIALYVAVGPLASRAGLAKRPYIGLSFVFFGVFPLLVPVLGGAWGAAGLMLAYVLAGGREIGEPARKAMIAELVPVDVKTQAIGLYWAARGVAVAGAAPVGALLWLAGERWHPGGGPYSTFMAAGCAGLAGAVLFYARFGRRAGVNR